MAIHLLLKMFMRHNLCSCHLSIRIMKKYCAWLIFPYSPVKQWYMSAWAISHCAVKCKLIKAFNNGVLNVWILNETAAVCLQTKVTVSRTFFSFLLKTNSSLQLRSTRNTNCNLEVVFVFMWRSVPLDRWYRWEPALLGSACLSWCTWTTCLRHEPSGKNEGWYHFWAWEAMCQVIGWLAFISVRT